MLRDVSRRSQETVLFGKRWAAPFGIAPMGASAVVAYDADNSVARPAREAGSEALREVAAPLRQV